MCVFCLHVYVWVYKYILHSMSVNFAWGAWAGYNTLPPFMLSLALRGQWDAPHWAILWCWAEHGNKDHLIGLQQMSRWARITWLVLSTGDLSTDGSLSDLYYLSMMVHFPLMGVSLAKFSNHPPSSTWGSQRHMYAWVGLPHRRRVIKWCSIGPFVHIWK